MANVREEEFQRYLQLFHDTYLDTAETLMPIRFRPRLLRRSLLPAEVIGYVSTQFGVGYEYGSSGPLNISTRKSSRRIEDALFQVPRRFQDSMPVFQGEGSAILINLNVEGGRYILLDDTADLVTIIKVRVKIGTWTRNVKYAELSAIRSADHWSDVKAVTRAKDEILEALVDLQQLEMAQANDLSSYLDNYKPHRVLVLGDFQPEGRRRLDEIKANLAKLGYYPIFVDEVPDIPHHDLIQKVVAIGSSSRFIVVDDSSRSGHLTEFDEVVTHRWHAIVLRLKGSTSSFMTRGVASSLQTMVEREYDFNSLPSVLTKAVTEVEARIDDRAAKLRALFPWRPSEDSPSDPDTASEP